MKSKLALIVMTCSLVMGSALAAEKPAKGKSDKAAPAAAPAAAAPAPAAGAPAETGAGAFNRLLRRSPKLNLSPMEDGIHDPTNPETAILQSPAEVLANWQPRRTAGNGVNWVDALQKGLINPRYERTDPTAVPVVMDMNILREAKGSMPNVVFPHKQHTEWLDCSNCHPAIFIPQKGANQISMAAIMLGQKCGVCHGKVAFPVTLSECARCHSKAKETPYKDQPVAATPAKP